MAEADEMMLMIIMEDREILRLDDDLRETFPQNGMHCDVTGMSEISVAKFVIPSEENNPEYWPDEGMSCEVKGCETPVIKSIGMYCKHWLRFHTKKTSIIICRLCQRKLGRRCYLLQHLRDFRKLNIKARTEEVLNTIPQLVDNMNNIDRRQDN
ncbi:Hypothetical predicted protein [Mytilus galloprovincialis]|uniref:Uncharacterized protein n=1 Tax=Mytilus galloprovincialis TaxID=29158 RepID=A0A8B6G0T9_MYTGA|nr:Hypothetical predicted protein [Mytilus galloprovincialis]